MDDDDSVRETILMMLQRLGYVTVPARDGEEAIELYQAAIGAGKPFDCVILDLTVPGAMGGKEAISRLLEIDPDVRAVVSSGYSADPVLANFERYGFGACLSKPFRMDALQATLSQYLDAQINARTE